MVKLSSVRNIGIAAHIDAGKTTLTERFLYYSGKIHRVGDIDEGDTQMDWMAQERERGITITAAATTVPWRNHEIHLIDTPGHVDFTIEVERSLRVLDGAVIILCAVSGVEPQSETVWHQADKFKVPRIVFINKMDRLGANFAAVVDELRTRFKANPAVIYFPIGAEDKFYGVVDIIEQKALYFSGVENESPRFDMVPSDMRNDVIMAREQLVELVADFDDVIAEKYLNGTEISTAELKSALRKGVLTNRVVPILCGTALRNKGVQPCLDAVVDYLPSPLEVPPIEGVNPESGLHELREPDTKTPFAALAFKIMMEHGRRQVYLRIYSGNVTPGQEVYNPRIGHSEKIARLFSVHANKRERIDKAGPGLIVTANGLKETMTGDTLCAATAPIIFEPIDSYEPVISAAIEARSQAEKEKLDFALNKIVDEDPTFQVRYDDETGQTLIAGMGELHLDIIIDRLAREYNVTANIGKPEVVFRETISITNTANADFMRQIEEKTMFGQAQVRIIPQPRSSGVEILATINDDADIPSAIISAALEGIKEGGSSGPHGYPLDDYKAELIGLEYRPSVSTETAHRIAAGEAMRQAVREAKPMLLEPIMNVEITAPDESLGDILGDLNARHSQITNVGFRGDKRVINANVPLRRMFGYATLLRSLSQGRASFSMQFERYDTWL
ncbi:MAG: elongation factor G [Deltaproteobacteria bacterium]|nr:elongation factor G [Deltaproteobacteria bacterium]